MQQAVVCSKCSSGTCHGCLQFCFSVFVSGVDVVLMFFDVFRT